MSLEISINDFLDKNRLLLELQIDPLCIVNNQSEIVFYNHIFKKWSKKEQSILSQNPKICDVIQHKECGNKCLINEALTKAVTLPFIEIEGTIGGNNFIAIVKIVPFSDQKNTSGFFIQFRDITEISRLKLKYKSLMKLTFDIIRHTESLDSFVKQMSIPVEDD